MNKKIFPLRVKKEKINLWKKFAKDDYQSTNQFLIKIIDKELKRRKK